MSRSLVRKAKKTFPWVLLVSVILYVFNILSFLWILLIWILGSVTIFLKWFTSTNLSVEITVWLAKFLPPSKQCVWDTSLPQFAWSKAFRDNHDTIYQEYLGKF